jgi:predicted nucleic acid-binding protein
MYLVDANVLIDAKNRYYAFDIAPGFWAWLERAHSAGQVCSIEAVRDELADGNDELAEWARANGAFFRAIDQTTTTHFPALTSWATSRPYTQAALAEFTGNDADYQLIAYARAHDHTLVTHERSNLDSRRRVMIPDACTAMGVTSLGPFEIMRRTGATLQLGD